MSSRIRPRLSDIGLAEWALVLWCLLMTGVLVAWMLTNTAPPPWDESYYLQTSVIFFHALRAGNLTRLIVLIASAFGGTKAPLISLIPLPIYAMAGPGYGSAIATNALLALVGWIVLFFYARHSLGPWRALAVVMIYTAMPLVIGISRQFLVETSLTDLVVIWMLLLQQSRFLFDSRYDNWLGVILGLGVLSKVDFPLYIGAPSVLAVLTVLSALPPAGAPRRVLLGRLTKILLIGVAISAVWYVPNLATVAHYAFSAGFGKIASSYSYGNPFSVKTVGHYLLSVADYGTSVYVGAAFVGVALALCAKYGSSLVRRVTRHERGPSEVLWLAVPLCVFLFGVNKDYRFLLPLLPVIPVLLVRGGSALIHSVKLRVILILLVLIGPVAMLIETSVPGRPLFPALVPSGFVLMSADVGYAAPPIEQEWHIPRVLGIIQKSMTQGNAVNGPQSLVLMIVDNPYFKQDNVGYYAAVMNMPFQISGLLTSSPAQRSWAPSGKAYALGYISKAQYLITKTGFQGPPFTTYLNGWLRSRVQSGHLPFTQIGLVHMPDGSIVRIYKRNANT
ncbi:MAG: ArnT family glycosyltransferase [Sulfobacillus sp.]